MASLADDIRPGSVTTGFVGSLSLHVMSSTLTSLQALCSLFKKFYLVHQNSLSCPGLTVRLPKVL